MGKLQKVAGSFKLSLGSHEALSDLLAYMRAALDLHQVHHWQTRGTTYYADHLLFMRIYDDSGDFIDQLAEKSIGLGSIELVDLCRQSEMRHRAVMSMCGTTSGVSPDEMVERSLQAEMTLVGMIKQTIETLEASGQLTHGLSNLLEGIADAHETFIYLLKQRNEQV